MDRGLCVCVFIQRQSWNIHSTSEVRTFGLRTSGVFEGPGQKCLQVGVASEMLGECPHRDGSAFVCVCVC